MIQFAIALVVLSLSCALVGVVSLLVPDAPAVDGFFVGGTVAALLTSGAFLRYVRRWRL